MSRKLSILLILLVVVFSLLGGFIAGHLSTPKITIVEEADQSNILTVEKLKIANESGKLLIELGSGTGIDSDLLIYDQKGSYINQSNEWESILGGLGRPSGGDGLFIYGQEDSIRMYIGHSESCISIGEGFSSHAIISSRIIGLQNKNFGRAYIRVSENEGARIGVDDKDSKGNAEISVNEYGGRFDAFSKVDNVSRASIWIGEYGYGGISLLDKDRYRLK